jgi:hypothetical protein
LLGLLLGGPRRYLPFDADGKGWRLRVFDLTDIKWSVGNRGGQVDAVTGQGRYRIGGSSGREQELELELMVGDRPVERFVSGVVEATGEFPAISVTVEIHLMPACTDTIFTLVATPSTDLRSFVRGDCNVDGDVAGSVSDAVFLLNFNFLGGTRPSCFAACDADADGQVSGVVTDAVYLLTFNFLGGPPPPAPFPGCGPGTEADTALGCETPPESCAGQG